MSTTTNNNQNQQGGAGQGGGANGIGAGNQGQPNQNTQQTQVPTAAAGGTAGIGGNGTNPPVVQAGVQLQAQGQQPANPHQLILWNGNWPGAVGKIADYMSARAGTPAAQKEIAEKVFDFIKNPTSHLASIGVDTQSIAYLLHVPGTTNIRVLYGLSPIVENPFVPDKPKFFRALIRDLENEQDRFPGIMRLPASIVDLHPVEVPTDTFYFDKLADAAIDKSGPWCKTGSAQDAMQNGDKETIDMMKLVPVPLYTVLDGLDQDLSAAKVAERIKFIDDIETKAYLRHALSFCKACATSYGASAREKIPTIAAGAFASIPSAVDKAWALGRTVQLCPSLTSPVISVQGDNTSATALAALAGFNAQMLDVWKEIMTHKNSGGQGGGRSADTEEEELLKDTWHGKLSMSKSGVAHLLRFCGLKTGQEHLIPKLWFRLGEK